MRTPQQEKRRAYHKAWRDRNKEHCAAYRRQYRGARRPAHLFERYRMTVQQFDAMLEEQGHACAICRQPPKPGTTLCVDHDHASGAVRGILCRRCNRGIGFFCDDETLMREAIEYVRRAKRTDAVAV